MVRNGLLLRLRLLLLLGFFACATAHGANEAPPERLALLEKVKVVGMLPAIVQAAIPHRDEVARRYEAEATARLTAAGFTVIPADEMRAIQDRLAKAVGGLYDPMTGEVSREKFDAHRRFSRTEYLETHKVDGFFRVAVIPRTATSQSSKAKWDGVEERVTGQSGLKSFMTGATGSLGDGRVPALSLVAYLEDREEAELYGRIAGLQLLGYTRMGWTPKHFSVDPKFLLRDPARDARAFAIVFDPLTGNDTTSKAKLELAPVQTQDADDDGISREKLLADYRRVALLPLRMISIAHRDEVAARYDAVLRAKLAAAGFEVVGGDEFPALWKELQTAAGGFYDPVTGHLDTARHAAARTEALRRLQERHGVSAVVEPFIVSRDASFQAGVAKWDGQQQIITGGKSRFAAMFSASGQYTGQMEALSLMLRIADLADRTVFDDYGGIEATSRFEVGRFVKLPEAQLLSDPALDAKAVDLSLAELTSTPRPR